MGIDVFAMCKEPDTAETKEMEDQMVNELGWSEPRKSHLTRWKGFYEEATGVVLADDRFYEKKPLDVHKMYIHALERQRDQGLSKGGACISEWLRICCEHNASILYWF